MTRNIVRRSTFAWGLLLVGLVCYGSARSAEKADDTPDKRVLYIGIDGCRFDALRVANTPNLDALMADGCWDEDTQILGDRYQGSDTSSGPGWSTILTGVWADKHGVDDNSFRGKNYQQYPHIFARLLEVRPDAEVASVVTWLPIQLHIVAGAKFGIWHAPDGTDYSGADALAADSVSTILAEQNPTAVFFYIGNVDETGHKVGFHPSVPAYVEQIERADELIGQVLASLRDRATFADEDWLVLVTSDHGGKGTGHGNGHDVPEIRNSFTIVSGPAAARGRLDEVTHLVDVPFTALVHLGVSIDPTWKLDGRVIGLRDK